ncbi:hypothetical protein H6770_00950 [Candidatus Peribacteria bacterium]|nr:hypothetical protein [Candidatus Peribacteria bacterium]
MSTFLVGSLLFNKYISDGKIVLLSILLHESLLRFCTHDLAVFTIGRFPAVDETFHSVVGRNLNTAQWTALGLTAVT